MFYTIILTDTQAIYAYPTQEQAEERFHSELSYAYNQHILCTCMVIDKDGAVFESKKTKFTAEVAND